MSELTPEQRLDNERIHNAIQASDTVADDDPEMIGAVLTGWALVAEWMSPDGGKWIARIEREGMTKWARDGLFHEALYGSWERP